MTKWFLAFVAICTGLLYFVVPMYKRGLVGQVTKTESQVEGYFYRMQASFSYKDTPLEFDYVVGCGVITSSSRVLGTSVDAFHTPKVMIKAVPDGGAVMLKTVKACQGQTTENGKVPNDLLPLAIWFDDVNDLTFGWGYGSDDAYSGPHAKLKFHKATVTVSTPEAWQAWRVKAKSKYVQKGMLPGPWGYSYSNADNIPRRNAGATYDPKIRHIARLCDAVQRVDVPDEVMSKINKLRPPGGGRFWGYPNYKTGQHDLDVKNILKEWDEIRYWETLIIHRYYGLGQYGVLRTGGDGVTNPFKSTHGLKYTFKPVLFPALPRSKSVISGQDISPPTFPTKILIDEGKWKGFMACGGDGPYDGRNLLYSEWHWSEWSLPIYFDDIYVTHPFRGTRLPVFIFDSEKNYMYITHNNNS